MPETESTPGHILALECVWPADLVIYDVEAEIPRQSLWTFHTQNFVVIITGMDQDLVYVHIDNSKDLSEVILGSLLDLECMAWHHDTWAKLLILEY